MGENSGQIGLSAQTRLTSTAQAGQIGLSVQLGSNVHIRLVDQLGRAVLHGLALTISYLVDGLPATETLAYNAARPVNRSLPGGTSLSVAAAGRGFGSISGTHQVPADGQLTLTLTVRRRANQLLRWR